MINICSTNPKQFLKLFPGWKKTLPYCHAGRPCYSSEEVDKYREKLSVECLWYDKLCKIIFERCIALPTNYNWGLRDVGTDVTIVINNTIINTCKTTRSESWQERTKFVTHYTKMISAPMERVLTALKAGKKTIPFKSFEGKHLVYLPKDGMWLELQYITDVNTTGFFYVGKHTPQQSFNTYYYTVHESSFEENIKLVK